MRKIALGALVVATLYLAYMSCSARDMKEYYFEKSQVNRYFVVNRKNVDYLTPATVVSLRDPKLKDVQKIAKFLPSLCRDYAWMNRDRFIYVFRDTKSSKQFDSFGIENIKEGKPIEKFLAEYNPDERSLIFFPLVEKKRKKVYLAPNWCENNKKKPKKD